MDPDDEEKQERAEEEFRTLRSIRRTLRKQGRLAFQNAQHKILQENITQDELERRRTDAKAAGQMQQMLLDAAEAARDRANALEEQDPEDEDEEIEDQYEADDLQDVRDRLETSTKNDDGVTVQNFSLNDPNQHRTPDHAAIAAACKTLLEILIGQKDVVKEALPCRLCQLDETVPEADKERTRMPGKLNEHIGTNYHSPKSKYLRHFAKGSKNTCPYPDCGETGTGPQILSHCHMLLSQTDEHLKAAAKDGLFARDFDPRILAFSTTKTRVKEGKAQKVQEVDPDKVASAALIPPRNLSKTGNLQEAEKAKKGAIKNEPTLRLPTKQPVTETGWWHEHEDGVYGDVLDTLQAQQRWLMTQADNNLRALGVGQASEKGETRKQAHKGKRRTQGIVKLRERLAKMGWRWAEDEDNILQPYEDDEEGSEWEGIADDDIDANADGD